MVTMSIENRFTVRGHSRVTDQSGNPLYDVKGTFSLWRKKRIRDLDGNVLYTVRNKMLKLPLTMHSAYIYDAEGNKIGRLKQKLRLKGQFDLIDSKEDYCITCGTIMNPAIDIFRNGIKIADGIRQVKIIGICDAFTVTCSEEDAPFVLTLIIAMDNIIDRH